MAEPVRVLLAFVLAAVPSLVLCRVVISLGIMDAPTEARKVQPHAVPTSGGVAVAIAAGLAVMSVSAFTGGVLYPLLLVTCAGALAALITGLLDDITDLRAIVKLGLLTAIAFGMAALGSHPMSLSPWPGVFINLPAAVAIAGSMAWLLLVLNAVNFMDGANGVAMGISLVAAVGMAVCAAVIGAWTLALLSAALAGALAGFLVWNLSGRLFVGDAGAFFSAAVLAGLGLELVRLRPELVLVPPILLLPFLSDVLLTLAWRAWHRKQLFAAHRDHVYQIALKAGLKHWQVALVHAVFAINAAIFAVIATILGRQAPALAFILLLGVSTWIHLRVRRSGIAAGLVGAKLP